MARNLPSGTAEPEWAPPAEFDGFRVVRLLGRGGMGEVYLGHDTTLDRPVALKFVATADPSLGVHERFLVEARAIARLNHPNVVNIFRVGQVLGRPYLAYEFIPGRSLDRLAKPIAWQKALEIGLGVARGLAAAHRRDVLHRDIKPANVILADTGEVKLLDFGIAKLLDAGARHPSLAPPSGGVNFRWNSPPTPGVELTVQASPDPETIALGGPAAPNPFPNAETVAMQLAAPPHPFLDAPTLARPALHMPELGDGAPTLARLTPYSGASAEPVGAAEPVVAAEPVGAIVSVEPVERAPDGPPLDAPPLDAAVSFTASSEARDQFSAPFFQLDPDGAAPEPTFASEPPAAPSACAPLPEPTLPMQRGPALSPAPPPAAASGSKLTALGALLGTPIYMAPELWSGEPASVQSDIYALGLVLFELVTGHVPHETLRGTELIEAILTRSLPSLGPMCPGVPLAFTEIVDRCLSKRREDRYASANELLEAMEIVHAVYHPFAEEATLAAPVDQVPIRVAASFARIARRADAFSKRLYDALFARHPSIRPLFPDDMSDLRRKLIGALQVAVENLHRPDRLVPVLEELGRKHAAFGVEPEHFDAVGEALIGALAEFDAEAWNVELEGAWTGAYTILAEAMQRGLAHERTTSAHVSWTSAQERDPPRTRYAQSGDINLAYQVLGEGSLDMVLALGWVTHLEVAWQCAMLARFMRRLGRSARLVAFDKRGTGLSDRVAGPLSIEDRIADIEAVMDAAGAERAVLFGVGDAAAQCALFAAARPERTRGLVLYGGRARMLEAPDYPHGLDAAALDALVRQIRSSWGEPVLIDTHAPSLAADESFRRWWAAYLRMASGPSAAIELLRASAALDIREQLAAVRAPTLVLHRADDAAVPAAAGRHLAERIQGARYIELPGTDHLPFVGDADALLAEVRRFLAGLG